MKESDILYEAGPYWVCASKKFKGFEVYKDGLTHATRVACIGYGSEGGLQRAKKEADRRHLNDKEPTK